eukprot:8054993-Pyramimonas_sp.AAC.1
MHRVAARSLSYHRSRRAAPATSTRAVTFAGNGNRCGLPRPRQRRSPVPAWQRAACSPSARTSRSTGHR